MVGVSKESPPSDSFQNWKVFVDNSLVEILFKISPYMLLKNVH